MPNFCEAVMIYFLIGGIASWFVLEVCHREMALQGTTLSAAHRAAMQHEISFRRPRFQRLWVPYAMVVIAWLPMLLIHLFDPSSKPHQ